MRRYITPLLLLAIVSAGRADAPPVTTQPTNSEVEDLRTQIKALQQENDLLRSTLAAAGKPVAPAPSNDEKPLAGIEALLQEFPSNELPGPRGAFATQSQLRKPGPTPPGSPGH